MLERTWAALVQKTHQPTIAILSKLEMVLTVAAKAVTAAWLVAEAAGLAAEADALKELAQAKTITRTYTAAQAVQASSSFTHKGGKA